jgi:hypothetical protein
MAGTIRNRKGRGKDAVVHKTGRAANYYNIPNSRYSLRNRPIAPAAPAVPPLFPFNSTDQAQVDRINRNIPKT